MCPLRPDIQYATKELTRTVQKQDEHDKQNAKHHLLRYLHGVLQFEGVTIATSSKTQQMIARSSTEAKLYAIGTIVKDVIYLLSKVPYTTTRIDEENKTHRRDIDMRYLHAQQLQSDGEVKNHKISTENNPADLMTKYLDTAKIKKHSERIGLHSYLGNKSINMISRSLRPRASYSTKPRATTPQPRQFQTRVTDNDNIKEEQNSDDDMFGVQGMVQQQYFGEEAARMDDNFNDENIKKLDFTKLLHYMRQFLPLLRSLGRLSSSRS
eukprot:5692705-Amphidinium_carterae.1